MYINTKDVESDGLEDRRRMKFGDLVKGAAYEEVKIVRSQPLRSN